MVCIFSRDFFAYSHIASARLAMFARPFEGIVSPSVFFPAVYFGALVTAGFAIYRPTRSWRIGACVFFLLAMSARFSFGKVNHSEHIWMITSILMCIPETGSGLRESRTLFAIRLAQSISLAHYFISGIWKVWFFKGTPSEMGLEQLASAIAESQVVHPAFISLAQNHSWVIGLGWFAFVLFEVSALIPIVLGRWFLYWGIAAIAFHTAIGVTMGIWFFITVICLFFLFVFTELELSQNETRV